MFGIKPVEMIFMVPFILGLWLLPIVAGIWALVTLSRIRKAQDKLQETVDALSRSLGRSGAQ